LEALASQGITEIAIVVGYRARQVTEALQSGAPRDCSLEFIHNPDYEGGSALSLRAARDFVGDDQFVLCMGDHIIERALVSMLLDAPPAAATLVVDSKPSLESQLNDATRVLVNGDNRLIRIGKRLRKWNAVDTGVFRFAPDVFSTVDDLCLREGDGLELTDVMRFLAAHDPHVDTCDVSGLFWTDVDTVEDYRNAEQQVEQLDELRL
jgi:choline kinase